MHGLSAGMIPHRCSVCGSGEWGGRAAVRQVGVGRVGPAKSRACGRATWHNGHGQTAMADRCACLPTRGPRRRTAEQEGGEIGGLPWLFRADHGRSSRGIGASEPRDRPLRSAIDRHAGSQRRRETTAHAPGNRAIRAPVQDGQTMDDQRVGSVVRSVRLKNDGGRSISRRQPMCRRRRSRGSSVATWTSFARDDPQGRAGARCPRRSGAAMACRRPRPTPERATFEASRARGPDVPGRAAGMGPAAGDVIRHLRRARGHRYPRLARRPARAARDRAQDGHRRRQRPGRRGGSEATAGSAGRGRGRVESETVSVWVIVADGRTNRKPIAVHNAMLRTAFPVDGRSVRAWLREPGERVAALSIWHVGRGENVRADAAPVRRVRKPRSRLARPGSSAVGNPCRRKR